MPITDENFWARLQVYDFPADSGGISFHEQIIRETGWTAARARVAVREYRRFLYLAGLGQGRIVPCKIVDEVWHQHMGHTREYWDSFCPDVLGQPLHHKPKRPAGHGTDYAQTLQRYAREFDAPPAYEIWIRPDIRRRRRSYALGLVITVLGLGVMVFGPIFGGAATILAGFVLLLYGRHALTLDLGIDVDWDALRPKGRKRSDGGCGASGGCAVSPGGHVGNFDPGGVNASCGGGGCGGGD